MVEEDKVCWRFGEGRGIGESRCLDIVGYYVKHTSLQASTMGTIDVQFLQDCLFRRFLDDLQEDG